MSVVDFGELEAGDSIEVAYLSVYNNYSQTTRTGTVETVSPGDPRLLTFAPDDSDETWKVVGGQIKIIDAPVWGKRADRVVGHAVSVSREKVVAGGH